MKNFRWQGIVFFFIIFILSIGLSYLAFNENSIEHVDKEQKMAIALVNEDEGASFNEEEIVFGDEFANSVTKDNKHDWYVVSRGVAESGFNRGSYDMMIVIPNDFSERSLSIHLERPEPVSLHYKINATGHENVRAEAEKTAGQILNDFNKRLIDVYFASIIGNLQEAQDNIGEIIEKEKEYTKLYNTQINSPLSNYTDQFKTVKDYTQISKDSYKGLEDILKNFGDNLSEDTKSKQQFTEEINSVIKTQEESGKIAMTFGEALDQFATQMRHEDVIKRLAEIERSNRLVHEEFQRAKEEEPRTKTIISNANLIERRFEMMSSEVDNFREDLDEKIHKDLQRQLQKRLEDTFKDDSFVNVKINDLFAGLDDTVHKEIREQIRRLPTLKIEEIKDLGLAKETERDLTNIVKVSQKYNIDYENRPGSGNNRKIETIKDKLDRIVDDLESGFTVTDTIELTDHNQGEVYFSLERLPKEYKFEHIEINGYRLRDFDPGTAVKIKPTKNELTVTLALKLREEFKSEIDLFSPLEWEWSLAQEGVEKETPSENIPPENNGEDEQKPDDNDPGENDEVEEGTSDHSDQQQEEIDQGEEGNPGETEEDGDAPTDEDGNEPPTDGEEDEGKEEEEEPEEQPIREIENNYLNQKVQSSLLKDLNEEEIMKSVNELVEFVSNYYRLFSLYELYFGFDMKDSEFEKNLNKIIDKKDSPLTTLVTEDSLYHMIYEKEIKDLIKDHILKDVTNQITDDVNRSMTLIDDIVRKYQDDVRAYQKESESLAEKIRQTKESADSLNSEVGALLEQLALWRDTSNELVSEQTVFLTSDQDVQLAIMSLDSGYQPLLLASESIADQAKVNFESADHVYQTFDAIDEQAENIQTSGVNLVTQAKELANKLTDKALEDADFADNFNDVLANSRIGDRQNENLYRFLANPVETKNNGVITKGESFTPYFLVIILTVVTLFTAYVISSIQQRRNVEGDAFKEERALLNSNLPIATITGGIGIIEGLGIGLLSFYLLQFDQGEMYVWIGVIIPLTLAMLLITTYLLRQLKMVGMFILLSILSIYLLLTKSLGFKFENKQLVDSLRQISPLQYVENLLTKLIEGNSVAVISIIILVLLAIGGFILNLFVIQKTGNKEGMENESMSEAN